MINKLKNFVKISLKNLRIYLSSTNNPLFIGYYKRLYKPKPNSLAAFFDDFSKALKGDVFVVQVGANDGITHDPIHKFIKRDNWAGVLIEPQKYVFEKYLKRIYQKNKEIIPVRAALGWEDGIQILYKIGFTNERWATGLASFDEKTIWQAYESGLVKEKCRKHGLKFPSKDAEKVTKEEVPVISPSSLMTRYEVSKIDLLQIDAEGYDYEIIKMFDIPSRLPKVIVYENIHISESEKNECKSSLLELGYSLRDFGPNTVACMIGDKTLSKYFAGK